jgi:uncharacterized membrane protein YphA (DoxX/SURF4 family)
MHARTSNSEAISPSATKGNGAVKASIIGYLRVIGYWVTTTIIALELLAGGVTDLIHGGTNVVGGEPVVEVLAHLGYPVYLLTILGVWKLPGGIALLVPGFPRLKEWAYAGAFFVYIGAAASAALSGYSDPYTTIWGPFLFGMITLASWALRPQSRTLGVLFSFQKRT